MASLFLIIAILEAFRKFKQYEYLQIISYFFFYFPILRSS